MPFLSHSVSIHDAAIAARLRALAAVSGITLELPLRPQSYYRSRKRRAYQHAPALSDDSQQKIDRSDVVIGLVTRDAPIFTPEVQTEINYAISKRKPVILLLEQSAALTVPPPVKVVHFDRANPMLHEVELLKALKAIRSEEQRNTLGAFVGVALGLLALAYLGSKK